MQQLTINRLYKIVLCCLFMLLCAPVSAQSISDDVLMLQSQQESKSTLTQPGFLSNLYKIKERADSRHLLNDSLYEVLLDKIAILELKLNKNYAPSLMFANEILQRNKSGKTLISKRKAVTAAMHMAYTYDDLGLNNNALNYYDTAIQLCKPWDKFSDLFLFSKVQKAYLFYKIGDYQKSIEESLDGCKYSLQKKDSGKYFSFLIQKAQSHCYLNQTIEGRNDVDTILKYASLQYYRYEVASALKIKALLNEKNNFASAAEKLFNLSISVRLATHQFAQIADDYNDWGNFYLNTKHDILKASECYRNVIKYAKLDLDSSSIAKGFINMAEAAIINKNFAEAIRNTIKAMNYLRLHPANDILLNPGLKQLNLIGNKEPIIVLMSNKTRLLFDMYKKSKHERYLQASINMALLTDSIISQTRKEQSGDQSKLYWRNHTRDLFETAMEVCYTAHDLPHAFYFMEKSRAVLLNDKLNELGASNRLSIADAQTEQNFKLRLAIEQQKLNNTSPGASAYNQIRENYIVIKDDFDHFIKTLETKYPAYYSYKYSDDIPSLPALQKHLAISNASFIHYFTGDTLSYILSITPTGTKLIRLSKKDFNCQQINEFSNYTANAGLLNTRAGYTAFAKLSNTLYKALFQPLHLPPGPVIVCSDNFLLPFESLCSDAAGKNFLIDDYIFSYAYSATYLLKQFNTFEAKGNFAGFAPVSFLPVLNVIALHNSAAALYKSADNYSNTVLFTNALATKNNFIKNIGGYTVVNIFSHASADSTDKEPRLYMQDATVNLSELQLIDKPATRLVVLSACQTNAGKNATGEGIYSLARGFTSAGIPSIAATLWSADEDMIYEISEKFHQNLARGESKDIALRNAKLSFLKNHRNSEKALPYYWANLILIGNTDPLQLSSPSHKYWWMAGGGFILIGLMLLLLKRSRSRHSLRLKTA